MNWFKFIFGIFIFLVVLELMSPGFLMKSLISIGVALISTVLIILAIEIKEVRSSGGV